MKVFSVSIAIIIQAIPVPIALCDDVIPISVESGMEVSWQSSMGFHYLVQYAKAVDSEGWKDLGPRVSGNDARRSVLDPNTGIARRYRVLQMFPDFVPASSAVANGGFEEGDVSFAKSWTGEANPPIRTTEEAHSGSFSMHCKLANTGPQPQEGRLSQRIRGAGSMIEGGKVYTLSFWTKNVSAGPSYVQQYHLEWLGEAGEILAAENYVNFPSHPGEWKRHMIPGLRAPGAAVAAVIRFRFVTGAIEEAYGEVYLDDVSLETGDIDPARQPRFIKVETNPASRISWVTRRNWVYLPFEVAIDASGGRSSLKPVITGDGGQVSIEVPQAIAANLLGSSMPGISLLSPGDLSVKQEGRSGLSLNWEKVEGKRVSYMILHGDRPGLLSHSIDTGEVPSGVIGAVEAGSTIYFAVLAIESGE